MKTSVKWSTAHALSQTKLEVSNSTGLVISNDGHQVNPPKITFKGRLHGAWPRGRDDTRDAQEMLRQLQWAKPPPDFPSSFRKNQVSLLCSMASENRRSPNIAIEARLDVSQVSYSKLAQELTTASFIDQR